MHRPPRLLHVLVGIACALVLLPLGWLWNRDGSSSIHVDHQRLDVVRNRLEAVRPALAGLVDPPGAIGPGRPTFDLDCEHGRGSQLAQPGAMVGWRTAPGAASLAAADLEAQLAASGLPTQASDDGAYLVQVQVPDGGVQDRVTVSVQVRGRPPCTEQN